MIEGIKEKGCHAIESQILNFSRRIYKLHVHLEQHPSDACAQRDVSKLTRIRNQCLKELWYKDFGTFKRIYLKCEPLYKDIDDMQKIDWEGREREEYDGSKKRDCR